MLGENLTAFISSTSNEFSDERTMLRQALEQHGIQACTFTHDAGAGPKRVQRISFENVAAADIYVGVMWNQCSQPVADEYAHARALRKPCFVYVKTPGVDRAPQLRALLPEMETAAADVTVAGFGDVAELAQHASRDIQSWLVHDWLAKSAVLDWGPPTRQRLVNDSEYMVKLLHSAEYIKLLSVRGRVPCYELMFQLPGIAGLHSDDEPVISREHIVKIQMHAGYPVDLPYVTFATPIVHPNIYESTGIVYMGWFHHPYSLTDVCYRIAEMIDFQSFYLHRPANPSAAAWVKRHRNRVPLSNWLDPDLRT